MKQDGNSAASHRAEFGELLHVRARQAARGPAIALAGTFYADFLGLGKGNVIWFHRQENGIGDDVQEASLLLALRPEAPLLWTRCWDDMVVAIFGEVLGRLIVR